MFFKHQISLLAIIFMLMLIAACSTSRDIPDGRVMLDRVSVVADGKYKDINTAQLKSYVRQKGNSRWFSVVKIPLGIYQLAGNDSTRWINRTLHSIGEAPVLFDSIQAQKTCEELQLALCNLGYLDAQVELFTTIKGKKLNVFYVLHPGSHYFIRNLHYDIQDSVIGNLLKNHKRGLHEGMIMNVNALNEERSRLTSFLQNNGYYRFHKEFITFLADSIQDSHQVDLTLQLGLYRASNTNDTLHTRYTIRHINYASGDPQDTVIHLRDRVLQENTMLTEGEPYSAEGLQNTYNHFGRLGAVRYTNINFQTASDSAMLDMDV